jgi:hypothetical protein
MKLGDNLKVKQGVLDPYLKKIDISGWQGRITFFYQLDDTMLIQIAWDSVTLKQMPLEFIKSYIKNKWGYAFTCIKIEDVELSKPRDSVIDVENLVEKMDKDYDYESYSEQDKRISKIFPSLDISLNQKNLQIYYEYLQKNLSKPIILTGDEDCFINDLIGSLHNSEDRKHKIAKPLYNDKYEYIELFKEPDADYIVNVIVERITDKKQFKLALWQLMCVDKDSKNFELINDFVCWFLNYQEQPPQIRGNESFPQDHT